MSVTNKSHHKRMKPFDNQNWNLKLFPDGDQILILLCCSNAISSPYDNYYLVKQETSALNFTVKFKKKKKKQLTTNQND